MRFLFLLLFAIPAAAQLPREIDRGSIQILYYNQKNCHHWDETSMVCSEAQLVFSRLTANPTPLPDEETVLFIPSSDGVWRKSIRYHPKKCHELPLYPGNVTQRFLCKGVSWRTAQ